MYDKSFALLEEVKESGIIPPPRLQFSILQIFGAISQHISVDPQWPFYLFFEDHADLHILSVEDVNYVRRQEEAVTIDAIRRRERDSAKMRQLLNVRDPVEFLRIEKEEEYEEDYVLSTESEDNGFGAQLMEEEKSKNVAEDNDVDESVVEQDKVSKVRTKRGKKKKKATPTTTTTQEAEN